MLCSLPMHQSIVVYQHKQVISRTPTKSNPMASDHQILEVNSQVHFLRWFVHENFLSINQWFRLLCGIYMWNRQLLLGQPSKWHRPTKCVAKDRLSKFSVCLTNLVLLVKDKAGLLQLRHLMSACLTALGNS